MYCRQCGARIKDGAPFCPKCGAQQRAAGAAGPAGGGVRGNNKRKRELPGKVLEAVALVGVVAVLVVFVVPSLLARLSNGGHTIQQEGSATLELDSAGAAGGTGTQEDDATTEAQGEDPSATLQLGAVDSFDYSQIELGKITRTDRGSQGGSDRQEASIFEWTVTNNSDQVCPVVALNIEWDDNTYQDGGYRDGEIVTEHYSIGDYSGEGNSDGLIQAFRSEDIRFAVGVGVGTEGYGDVDGSSRLYVYELAPGEVRRLFLSPSDSGWADDEKTIYAFDNVSMAIDPQKSDEQAQKLRGTNAKKVLPEDWDISEPQVVESGDGATVSFTFTNTTDSRLSEAHVYFASFDSDGRPITVDGDSLQNLEPGETRTIETHYDAYEKGDSYQVLLVDVEYES